MSERYELKVTRLANETLGRYYNEQKARAEKAERELAEARAEVADLTQRLDYASTRFPQSVPQSVCDYLAGVARGEPDAVQSMMPFWAKVRPEDLAALLRERETAGATIEASDTTRREWEVRAAESYAAGRAAGLREAADLLDAERPGHSKGVLNVLGAMAARMRTRALAPPAAETVNHTITATSFDGRKASPYACDALPVAEPRDEGES